MNINCDIVYNNEAKTYQSGKSIGAEISLTFSTPVKCRCKCFTFCSSLL